MGFSENTKWNTGLLSIVGGKETFIKNYPSLVVIFNDGRANCGGVVINSKWILTTGLCFMAAKKHDFNETRVLAGTTYLSDGGSWHSIKKGFKTDVMNYPYDAGVAVMKVTPPFKMSGSKIKPAILPTQGQITPAGKFVTIVTHGGIFDPELRQSDELRKVDLQTIDISECNKYYNTLDVKISDSCFCTNGYKGDADRLCMYQTSEPTYEGDVVVGFRIWDGFCEGHPNVYARISKYTEWILSKTKTTK